MDRVNGADFVDIGGGRRGFRSQNLGGGVIGTEVTSAWLNAVQENLMKVIEAAGFEGDIANWDLLWMAIQLGQSSRSDIPVLGWQSAPPGAPTTGARYIVKAAGTGAWAGHDGEIAAWLGGAWAFAPPMTGMQANFVSGGRFVVIWFDGAEWNWLADAHGIEVFDAAGSGTFTAPFTGLFGVQVIGGGGGGGICRLDEYRYGGSGGGGGVAEGLVRLEKDEEVPVTTGTGGAGATNASFATGGGTSSFGAHMSATGGGPGKSSGDDTLQGGFSGSGTGGDLTYGLGDGDTGGDLSSTNQALFAPGKGGGPGGQAGAGSGVDAWPGRGPGGGGGGCSNLEAGSIAGAGHAGIVVVTW